MEKIHLKSALFLNRPIRLDLNCSGLVGFIYSSGDKKSMVGWN